MMQCRGSVAVMPYITMYISTFQWVVQSEASCAGLRGELLFYSEQQQVLTDWATIRINMEKE